MKFLTAERIIRFSVVSLVILGFGYLIMSFGKLFGFVLLSLVIAYVLNPLVNRLQSRGIRRVWGIALVLVGVGTAFFFASKTFIPLLGEQILSLTSQINERNIRTLSNLVERELTTRFSFLPQGFVRDNLVSLIDQLLQTGAITEALSNVLSIFANVFYALLVVPFSTFFFLKDGNQIQNDLLQIVPNDYFETTLALIDKIERSLGRYLKSVFLQSTIVATCSWIFLSIAGLQNAFFVGMAIGAANTIPYFGPILGYLLSSMIAIVETGDLSLIFPVIVAVFVVQLIDNILLQPLIFSRSAQMHPLVILFVILIAADLGGILGMVVAVPVATIIKITIEQIIWSIQHYYVFRPETAAS